MDDFESIRPYLDDEVPEVLARLGADPDLMDAVSWFRTPRLARVLPGIARWAVGREIRRSTQGLSTVADVQAMLESYVDTLVDRTTASFAVNGLDALPADQPHLFISNHRDIVMDSAFINLAIHRAGHTTSRIAVGDNLFTRRFASDLMRLNKSFVVERSAKGPRAVYAALRRTSNYIRCSLSEGHSVWIAQREGRSKDGFDRTDPALLKMLALAWRKEIDSFGELGERLRIVPVAVSYELDPCDRRKAHELYVTEATGSYEKPRGEDLRSIVDGMVGYKGRVHLEFGAPVNVEADGPCETAEDLAIALDERIVGGLTIFPTNVEAARQSGVDAAESELPALPEVMTAFQERLSSTPVAERPFLLEQYANPIRNQQSI